ncbi:MAG: CHASE2 domain-containing protein [Acidobacteriota bacterium]|nr:MAG: CHASE2 domain-containing protein [Acidobacteriota bacterium]
MYILVVKGMVALRSLPIRSIAVLLFLLLLVITLRWGFLEQIDALAYDFAFRLRGEQPADPRIVIVAIDDGSLVEAGPWPWAPEQQDRLFEQILSQSPRGLGLDLLLSRSLDLYPSLGGDRGVVVGTALGLTVDKGERRLFWQEPEGETEHSLRLGHIHADKDPAGVCRSIPLRLSHEGVTRWAFAVEMAALAYGDRTDAIQVDARRFRLTGLEIPRLASPIDQSIDSLGLTSVQPGDRLLINSRGGVGTFLHVSAAALLRGDPEALAAIPGKLVLVGATSYSLGDHLATAFSGPSEMPGIEIHANAIDTILNQRFVGALGDSGIIALLAVLVIVFWSLFYRCSRLRSVLVFLLTVLGAILLPVLIFLYAAYWLPVVSIAVAVALSSASAQFMHHTQLNQHLNERFRRLEELVRESPPPDTIPHWKLGLWQRSLEWKLGILGDVTEAALRADREREEMLSFVSHELKTPLTSIHGFADLLLLGGQLDETAKKEALGLIRSETDRLSKMVEDYLKISRLEHRSLEPKLSDFELRPMLSKVASLIETQLKEKSMQVKGLDTMPAVTIRADLNLLTQVFLNLLGNAVKFSPPESTINVSAAVESDEVVVSIADQGPGIPEKELPKVFDKFYRVKEGAARKVPGSGLGLAFVKEVVHRHGGTVSVKSQLGLGSTFRVSLPFDVGE